MPEWGSVPASAGLSKGLEIIHFLLIGLRFITGSLLLSLYWRSHVTHLVFWLENTCCEQHVGDHSEQWSVSISRHRQYSVIGCAVELSDSSTSTGRKQSWPPDGGATAVERCTRIEWPRLCVSAWIHILSASRTVVKLWKSQCLSDDLW